MVNIVAEINDSLAQRQELLIALKRRDDLLNDPSFQPMTYTIEGFHGLLQQRDISNQLHEMHHESQMTRSVRALDNSLDLLRTSLLLIEAQMALVHKDVKRARDGASRDHGYFSTMLLQTLHYKDGLENKGWVGEERRHKLAAIFTDILVEHRVMSGDNPPSDIYMNMSRQTLFDKVFELRLDCAGITLGILNGGMLDVAARQHQTFLLLKSVDEGIYDKTPALGRLIDEGRDYSHNKVGRYELALSKIDRYLQKIVETALYDQNDNEFVANARYQIRSLNKFPNLDLVFRP